jgi:hypothetical protein
MTGGGNGYCVQPDLGVNSPVRSGFGRGMFGRRRCYPGRGWRGLYQERETPVSEPDNLKEQYRKMEQLLKTINERIDALQERQTESQ